MQRIDVFFDLCLNKGLSKQWWGWWFGMPLCLLCRHCNVGAGYQHVKLLHCSYSSFLLPYQHTMVMISWTYSLCFINCHNIGAVNSWPCWLISFSPMIYGSLSSIKLVYLTVCSMSWIIQTLTTMLTHHSQKNVKIDTSFIFLIHKL